MDYEGNPEVIHSLLEKGRLEAIGEPHDHIRLLLILSGGLMRGINGAGFVQTLLQRGLGKVFTRIVTASVGAPTASYFLAEQLGTESIFYEECCQHDFVSWRRALLDRDYIYDVFAGSTGKGIAVKKVLNHSTKLTVLTTDWKTGRPHYHTSTTEKKFWPVLRASMTVSALCPEPVMIAGRPHVDGGFGDPVPLAAAIRSYQPTHVLVFMNYPQDGHGELPWSESIPLRFLPFIRNRHSEELLQTVLDRGKRVARSVRLARRCKMPIGIIWSDPKPDPFCRKPEELRQAFKRTTDWTHQLLDGGVVPAH